MRKGAPSATALIAEAIRKRTPSWVHSQIYDHMFVSGEPGRDAPGRHIVCDGLTDHPIIAANINGIRVVIDLPRLSDGADRDRVLDILTTAGALDPIS